MSMWLTLAKIDPASLQDARTKPDFVTALLDDALPEADSHGEDFRAIDQMATGRAEVEEGTADWAAAYPWLAKATTGDGCEALEDEDFGYGPAFVLTPAEVRQTATGLAAEGWSRFLDLAPFIATAATEGKAVVGVIH